MSTLLYAVVLSALFLVFDYTTNWLFGWPISRNVVELACLLAIIRHLDRQRP